MPHSSEHRWPWPECVWPSHGNQRPRSHRGSQACIASYDPPEYWIRNMHRKCHRQEFRIWSLLSFSINQNVSVNNLKLCRRDNGRPCATHLFCFQVRSDWHCQIGASELCRHGIRVNCISPFAIPTAFAMDEDRVVSGSGSPAAPSTWYTMLVCYRVHTANLAM